MADKTYWNTIKAESGNVLGKVKAIIHEGNVRRLVVKHDGRTVAEFPLTAGVVGAVLESTSFHPARCARACSRSGCICPRRRRCR